MRDSVVLCSLAVLAILLAACSPKPPDTEIPPKPVQTALSEKKDVEVCVEAFGKISASVEVDIKAQVTGKIAKIHFTEGDEVKAGQLLFSIDDAVYAAEVQKAEAEIDKDKVELKMCNDTLARNRKLMEDKITTAQDFEQFQTNYDAKLAEIEVDKADIQSAKINLDYCAIKSPIDGIVGKYLVDEGNIVPANTGATLVNIKAMTPAFVDFSLTEKEFDRMRAAMSAGTITLMVKADTGNAAETKGELLMMDNSIDNTTGTIQLRGRMANTEKQLWPGQFVHVRAIVGIAKDAVIVPAQAVQVGQQGHYVFVVKDGKAALSLVEPGPRWNDWVVIEKGVSEGEKVVTLGHLGLFPGATVQEGAPKAPGNTKPGNAPAKEQPE